MNKDNAAQYLPLVQALAEGKTLQLKTADGAWETYAEFYFCLRPEYYRIKPDPQKLYVATWFDEYGGVALLWSCIKEALEDAHSKRPGFKIHELDCGEAP